MKARHVKRIISAILGVKKETSPPLQWDGVQPLSWLMHVGSKFILNGHRSERILPWEKNRACTFAGTSYAVFSFPNAWHRQAKICRTRYQVCLLRDSAPEEPWLVELIKGWRLITEARVTIPPGGFAADEGSYRVQLSNGDYLTTDLVILATGQKPNNSLIDSLGSSDGEPLINPKNGFIRVRPTLQFFDSQYSNLFAVGDIADTGMHKAARPGSTQAAVVAKNIQALIEGREPEEHVVWAPAGIHLSLGLVSTKPHINRVVWRCAYYQTETEHHFSQP